MNLKIRATSNPTARATPHALAGIDFTVSVNERVNIIDAGSATPSTTLDIDSTTNTGATFDTEADVGVESDNYLPDLTITSLTPSIATVSGGGAVTRVANGTARIRVATRYLTKDVDVPVSRTVGGSTSVETGYTSGSLAAHIHAQINALIDGKGTGDMPLFTSKNDSTSTYVRNTGNWAASVLPVFTSTWTTTNGTRWPITAISPQYAIGVKHKTVAVGATVRWIAADNTLVTRTIDSLEQIGFVSSVNRDITVYKLSSALPESIGFAKVLPAGVADYLPSVVDFPRWRRIPLLAINAAHKAITQGWFAVESYNSVAIAGGWANLEGDASTFHTSFTNGDSSSPLYAIIDGEAVLVSCTSGVYQGTVYHKVISEINAKIDTLGGSETLTTVNLSGFTSYA